MSGADRAYVVLVVFLIVATGAGLYDLQQRHAFERGRELELVPFEGETDTRTIDVVASEGLPRPGVYSLPAETSLGDLLDTVAGGTANESLVVTVAAAGEPDDAPQRVDLNRADAWLLEALPGIGEQRAAAIIAYRTEHGGFLSTDELLFVEGIGRSVYEDIRDLVTVTPYAPDGASVP